jgi:hypothetical protein
MHVVTVTDANWLKLNTTDSIIIIGKHVLLVVLRPALNRDVLYHRKKKME